MPNYDLEMAESVIAARELEIERLQALHLERTKSTHKALTERDEKISLLSGENSAARAMLEYVCKELGGNRDACMGEIIDEVQDFLDGRVRVSEGQWRGESNDQPGSCYYCGKHRSLHREGKLPECRQG